jgi:hypothetical protein
VFLRTPAGDLSNSTYYKKTKFSSSVAFWAEICSAILCSACVANAGVRNVVLPRSEVQI